MYDGNTSYELVESYPQLLYVPQNLSDEAIEATARQRSMQRIQALTWVHPVTKAPLVRIYVPANICIYIYMYIYIILTLSLTITITIGSLCPAACWHEVQ